MSGSEIRAQNDAMSDSQNSAWIEFLEVYTGVDTIIPGAKDMGDAEIKRRILRMSDAEYEAWEEFRNLLNGADYDYAEDKQGEKWQSLPNCGIDGAPPAENWDYQVSRYVQMEQRLTRQSSSTPPSVPAHHTCTPQFLASTTAEVIST